ncbi:MAG: DNA mismatch repair endonuclease MutL, partial [Acetobacteraceae bacterium]|nr:DNA mismatch repair endonuclease MutL [Acetobacteraceae bacterium]
MPIRILPETTANRIAAGEVVERPAAVVKELVENALDAGASRVSVTLEDGGIGRVVVEDDGAGMAPGELELAVERHATSKLPEEALLFRIATLGFRGEALPSIGAVSRLSITSRPRDGGDDAHAILVEGGRKGAVRPASGAPGTRVEMRDLFYAVPARRKFLRQPRAEADRAVETVRRLALAWPAVGFRVFVDGREALSLQPATREGRVHDLLGLDFAAAALPVSGEAPSGLSLSGLAAQPAHTRPTGAAQHLVVNRRPVQDKMLRTALHVAYRDLIAAGRQPAAALFLDLPPEAVDVNVHPMKTELRFRDEAAVRGLLISALRRALGAGAGAAAAPVAGLSQPAPAWRRPLPRPTGFAETQAAFGVDLAPPAPFAPSAQPARLPLGFAPPRRGRGRRRAAPSATACPAPAGCSRRGAAPPPWRGCRSASPRRAPRRRPHRRGPRRRTTRSAARSRRSSTPTCWP